MKALYILLNYLGRSEILTILFDLFGSTAALRARPAIALRNNVL